MTLAPGVRSSCRVCGPYVVDTARRTEVHNGVAQVEIPLDFKARHEAGEVHQYLAHIHEAYDEATHWRQTA